MCDVRIEHFPIFSFLILFFRNNKALTSDFQRFFSFFALDSLHKDRESLSGTAAPYSPFFGAIKDVFS